MKANAPAKCKLSSPFSPDVSIPIKDLRSSQPDLINLSNSINNNINNTWRRGSNNNTGGKINNSKHIDNVNNINKNKNSGNNNNNDNQRFP